MAVPTASTCTRKTRVQPVRPSNALYCLPAWRETPFYSERERAALAWTEAVTQVSEDHVPDEVFELARKQFSEEELADSDSGDRLDQWVEPVLRRFPRARGNLRAR